VANLAESAATCCSAGAPDSIQQMQPLDDAPTVLSDRPQTMTTLDGLLRTGSIETARSVSSVDRDNNPDSDVERAFHVPIGVVDRILRYITVDIAHRSLCAESGLLGSTANGKQVYLNVSDPFAMICVGVQGGGKSHTTACVIENCLLPCLVPTSAPLVMLRKLMCALLLHYDQSETNVCEATWMVQMSSTRVKRCARPSPWNAWLCW